MLPMLPPESPAKCPACGAVKESKQAACPDCEHLPSNREKRCPKCHAVSHSFQTDCLHCGSTLPFYAKFSGTARPWTALEHEGGKYPDIVRFKTRRHAAVAAFCAVLVLVNVFLALEQGYIYKVIFVALPYGLISLAATYDDRIGFDKFSSSDPTVPSWCRWVSAIAGGIGFALALVLWWVFSM